MEYRAITLVLRGGELGAVFPRLGVGELIFARGAGCSMASMASIDPLGPVGPLSGVAFRTAPSGLMAADGAPSNGASCQ